MTLDRGAPSGAPADIAAVADRPAEQPAEQPAASVVVTTGGREEHLERLLASLATSELDLEIILVDVVSAAAPLTRTGSQPDHTRWPVRRLHCPPTHGGPRLAAARNLGARSARSRVLVFLDVDCLAFGDCVAQDVANVRRFPRAIVCGPVRHLERTWTDGWAGQGPEGLDRRSRDLRPDLSSRLRVGRYEDYDRFWSLRFACTRATYGRVGGFDEGYVGYGGEDTDFARRARDRGIAMVWHPGTPVYHQWHSPSRHGHDAVRSIVANARRFRSRWGEWPMAPWLAELAAQGRVTWDPTGDLLESTGG